MDVRYGAHPKDARHYDTQQLRDEFLIEKVFVPEEVTTVYSHIDRVITMGAMPLNEPLHLEKSIFPEKDLGVSYFLERRELGIINLGGSGTVVADGDVFKLERLNALYIGKETREVLFSSEDPSHPAKFYMTSAPAHTKFETRLITLEAANKVELGSLEASNKRVIYQLIHPAILETCQLSMGCTLLEPGCVWNSMPCHTHQRRMEVYLYFDVSEDNLVFHYMGEPQELRSIAMHNEQAVLSPSWSVHFGCGTSHYSFVWAMAGENRTFTDMDHIKVTDLR